jgi:hypothetical protein
MKPENDKNEIFKDIYKSAIRASYFGGMQNPEFMKKSKMNIKDINDRNHDNIDEKTFRMMKGFKRF